MGRVIDLEEWRAARESDLVRLERAIGRLDVAVAAEGASTAPGWLVTEVLAIQGCISLGRHRDAARRTERALERWMRVERRRGRGA